MCGGKRLGTSFSQKKTIIEGPVDCSHHPYLGDFSTSRYGSPFVNRPGSG